LNNLRPFHLAIPVSNINKSKTFYIDLLGCNIGRYSETWIDLDFFGHQLVLHESKVVNKVITNDVDLHKVPVPHFGVILNWDDWHLLSKNIKSKIQFIIQPHIRFKNKVGEQATMFFLDPDQNAIEFKAFKDDSQIFEN
jgi:extradiol dioxygenase family protein